MNPSAVICSVSMTWEKKIKPLVAPDVKLMLNIITITKITVRGNNSDRMYSNHPILQRSLFPHVRVAL